MPEDELGRTSMTVLDIAWLKLDTQAVVLFSAGYFCILSILGYPVAILQSLASGPKHFATIIEARANVDAKSCHIALLCTEVAIHSLCSAAFF